MSSSIWFRNRNNKSIRMFVRVRSLKQDFKEAWKDVVNDSTIPVSELWD